MISKRLFIGCMVIAPSALCLAQSDPPALQWATPITIDSVTDVTFDVLGNTIVGASSASGDGEALPQVICIRPDGQTHWTYTHLPQATAQGQLRRLAADLDGNVYAALSFRLSSNSQDRPAVIAIRPDGSLRWSSVLPQAAGANTSGAASRLAIDPDGYVYVSGYEGTEQSVFVARLSPSNGEVEWIYRTAALGSAVMDIAIDRSGRLYGAWVTNANVVRVTAFDPVQSNGTSIRWLDTIITPEVGSDPLLRTAFDGTINVMFGRHLLKFRSNGERIGTFFDRLPFMPDAAESDRLGNLYCSGRGTALACSVDANGALRWTSASHAYVGPSKSCLALDRLGNPYVSGRIGPFGGFLKKLDRDSGAPAWSALLVRDVPILAATVDNGTGIAIATWADVVRYSQQYIDIPETYRNAADFRIEQASIWHPDFPSFEFEYPFGTGDMCWNQSNGTGCQYNLQFDDVNEQRSALGYGGRVQMSTDGRLRFGFRAEATAGSLDIAYPGEAEIAIPGTYKWNAGQTVTIETNWTPSPNAALTGRGKPTLNAGVVVSGDFSVFADARAWSPEGSATFVHLNQARNLNPATYIVSIFGLGGGAWQNGVWFSLCEPTNYVCGNWRIPPLDINAPLMNGQMTSNAADLFMAIRGNLTQIMSVSLLGFPTILRYPPAQGGAGGVYDAAFEFRLMQAYIQHSFEALQSITWTPQPKVKFDWNLPGFPTEEITLGEDLTFEVPPSFDGQVIATPILSVAGTLRNQTTIRFIPNIGFESASISGNIAVGPVTVFSEELCLGCVQSPDPGLPALPGYDRSYSLSPADKELAPIQINGQGLSSQWPVVSAASRESLSMILYDQFSPRQSDFNAIVNRHSRLLIYGEDFFASQNPVARIDHFGAAESLPTTRLNDNTLLVEIPNRFRLVPGIARLSVRNTLNGQFLDSNRVDLPIEYPIPNLATVNPNLWAADPALKTVPVSVIDGLSSAGNNTFIARRDYYLVLRDLLWNASTAGGIGAAAYFNKFDFNDPPGFPSVLFEGVPLSRFEQPVDNGIHNVRLPEAAYAAPRLVNVVLQNPPPVHAASQTLQLTIAAPRPVISGFDPPTAPPGEGFTLLVKGPSNVPFWENYEEPKYGNFTATSVVLWDGIELPTKFVHSGALQVAVPAELVQDAGYHHITVETESGGSSYFEQFRNGDGAVVRQGLVPSGCSFNAAGEILCGSDPMVFAVEYPQPFIAELMPSTLDACAATTPGEPLIAFAITGTGFAPDCRLFLDGTARPLLRVSAELLQITVSPEEIATPGVMPIFVENPGPYGGVSNVTSLEIILTDCNSNGAPDQCEINAGTVADCNANRVPDACDLASGIGTDANGNGILDECELRSACPGDTDGDRDVDIADLAQLLARFGTTEGARPAEGDTDSDGDVDLGDLAVLLVNFGSNCQ